MFSFATSPPHPPYHHASSPLTPRSTNITPSQYSLYNSSSKMPQSKLEPSQPIISQAASFSPIQTRPTPFAPDFPQTPLNPSRRRVDPRRALSQSAEQKRGQRRDSYMKKIKEQREEGRWDVRGDQILYDSYVNERKAWERWEQDQARQEHFEIEQIMDDGLEPQPPTRNDRVPSDDEFEDLLERERRELEALVAMHEQTPDREERMEEQDIRRMPRLAHQQSSPYLGPEDGDFEELLLDDAMDVS